MDTVDRRLMAVHGWAIFLLGAWMYIGSEAPRWATGLVFMVLGWRTIEHVQRTKRRARRGLQTTAKDPR